MLELHDDVEVPAGPIWMMRVHHDGTVEFAPMAEEWEYAIDWGDDGEVIRAGDPLADTQEVLSRLRGSGCAEARLVRRRPASPWKPVPLTPEEADRA